MNGQWCEQFGFSRPQRCVSNQSLLDAAQSQDNHKDSEFPTIGCILFNTAGAEVKKTLDSYTVS